MMDEFYRDDLDELRGFYDDDEDFYDDCEDFYDDDMDGDHQSGLASAGWGTDEDYGSYSDPEDYGSYGDAA